MKYLLFPDMSGYAVERIEKFENGKLLVRFDGVDRGTMFVSDAAIPITNGCAMLSTRSVSEGRNPVSIFKERSRESFDCGYLVREENSLRPEIDSLETDFIYLKNQLYTEREARLSLEKRIADLEEKINGYKIF